MLTWVVIYLIIGALITVLNAMMLTAIVNYFCPDSEHYNILINIIIVLSILFWPIVYVGLNIVFFISLLIAIKKK